MFGQSSINLSHNGSMNFKSSFVVGDLSPQWLKPLLQTVAKATTTNGLVAKATTTNGLVAKAPSSHIDVQKNNFKKANNE
jgi:hypothetical protein